MTYFLARICMITTLCKIQLKCYVFNLHQYVKTCLHWFSCYNSVFVDKQEVHDKEVPTPYSTHMLAIKQSNNTIININNTTINPVDYQVWMAM